MNILLTSVGRRSYLVTYFKNALSHLGREGKVIACNAVYTTAMQVADKAYQTPLIYDKAYIPMLLDICKKEHIDMLVSLFDIDLPILAKNKEVFRDLGVKMFVSDIEFVDVCNDKVAMQTFLKKQDLPRCPTFSSPKEVLEVEGLSEEGILSHKYLIKPRWGMGSLSIFSAETPDELRVFYQKAKKEIQNSYLKFEAGQSDENVIIQEKLAGTEYGLDIINDIEGNFVTTIVREKLAMRAGETDIAKVIAHNALEKLGEKIAKVSRHIGNLDVDVISSDGQYFVIDMNVRFGGGYPFSHQAGIDLPLAYILWASGEKVDMEIFRIKHYGLYAKDITLVALED